MKKKLSYLIIFSFLSFSSNINASSRTEKEKALDDIFTGINKNRTEQEMFINNEINKYAIKYIEIVKKTLIERNKYIGESCRVSMTISNKGEIENVTAKTKSKFCHYAINKIKEIKWLPMPNNKEANEALRKILLTIQPE